MNNEFNSLKELYDRVEPALSSKVNELKVLGTDITKYQLWNLFINNKWKFGHNLMLCDIVDDILNTSYEEINLYLENNENII